MSATTISDVSILSFRFQYDIDTILTKYRDIDFRLVPKSVTLNDLERRNSHNVCVITLNSVAFGTDCVKVVEDTPLRSAAEM